MLVRDVVRLKGSTVYRLQSGAIVLLGNLVAAQLQEMRMERGVLRDRARSAIVAGS